MGVDFAAAPLVPVLVKWGSIIVASLLAVHVLKTILKPLVNLNALEIAEILLTCGLLYFLIKMSMGEPSNQAAGPWYQGPMGIVVALLVWGIFSPSLWFFDRLIQRL